MKVLFLVLPCFTQKRLVSEMKNADLIEGLVNSAPYLCCSVMHAGHPITGIDIWVEMDNFLDLFDFGRHLYLARVCQQLVAFVCARFFLGFGIGVKSATVPAYAAECTPKHVRGALVMLWQFFTAVGIMFGFVSALAFYMCPTRVLVRG